MSKIMKLKVENKTFYGENVPDGIFSSIAQLKQGSCDMNPDSCYIDFAEEYRLILDICQSRQKIPLISKHKSSEILKNMRKEVNDAFSITASQYINAGHEELEHFN